MSCMAVPSVNEKDILIPKPLFFCCFLYESSKVKIRVKLNINIKQEELKLFWYKKCICDLGNHRAQDLLHKSLRKNLVHSPGDRHALFVNNSKDNRKM